MMRAAAAERRARADARARGRARRVSGGVAAVLRGARERLTRIRSSVPFPELHNPMFREQGGEAAGVPRLPREMGGRAAARDGTALSAGVAGGSAVPRVEVGRW